MLTAALAALSAPQALAGTPQPWGLNLQEAATEKMADIHVFHDLLLVIITAISLFVLALLVWIAVRYNARANPTPSKTTHNTLLEVVWTVVPVVILVVIAVPSFRLLYKIDTIPQDVGLTVKAIGKQWYWTYEYPDHGNFAFDSLMLDDAAAKAAGKPRLLGADNALVVPAGVKVRVIVTASDVIHAFMMPSFGIQMYGIPGRLNQTWFEAKEPGTYYGQCGQLCGARHAFMPIEVKVVPQAEFDAWVASAKQQFGAADETVSVAAAR